MTRHQFQTYADRLRDVKKQPGDREFTVSIRDKDGVIQGNAPLWARDLQDANNCASATGLPNWSIHS